MCKVGYEKQSHEKSKNVTLSETKKTNISKITNEYIKRNKTKKMKSYHKIDYLRLHF